MGGAVKTLSPPMVMRSMLVRGAVVGMSVKIEVIDAGKALFVSPGDRHAVVYGKRGVGWALVTPDRDHRGVTARFIPGGKAASGADAVKWARHFMKVNNIDWLDSAS
ncbi:hypothetical protein [Streptomyces sp. NPDC048419]|uniref:hypothetical protein n=1 Tax=Streptomyces sp. NPDC048419 TaxID=3365547 RepID=UPI00371281A7